MDILALKSTLRKEMNARRKALNPTWVEENSRRLFKRWKSRFPVKQLAWLHVFQSIKARNEVDTQPFFDFMRTKYPDVRMVVPIVDEHLGRLRHAYIPEDIEMELNRWGIPEPKCPVEFIAPMMMDMVLVPLLAFDMKGNRLGYGKGYYDQFLPLLRPGCPKIGLAFEMQKVDGEFPVQAHDIPLDYIVTEERVYQFNQNFLF